MLSRLARFAWLIVGLIAGAVPVCGLRAADTILGDGLIDLTQIEAISATSDGSALACCAHDGTVWVLDLQRNGLRSRLQIPRSGRSFLAISDDGRYLLTAIDESASLDYWDLSDPRESSKTELPCKHLRSIALSADGALAVAGADDGRFFVFDPHSASILWSGRQGGGSMQVALSRDSARLATGGGYGEVIVWDLATRTEVHRHRPRNRLPIRALLWADAGAEFASATDKNVTLRLVEGTRNSAEFNAARTIYAIAVSPDGTLVCAGTGEITKNARPQPQGRVLVWNRTTGKLVLDQASAKLWVHSAAFLSDRSIIAVGDDGAKLLHVP